MNPFYSLILLGALLSALGGYFYSRVRNRLIEYLLHLVGPIAIASLIYLCPQLAYNHDIVQVVRATEFRSWYWVFIANITMFAVPASIVAGIVCHVRMKRRTANQPVHATSDSAAESEVA